MDRRVEKQEIRERIENTKKSPRELRRFLLLIHQSKTIKKTRQEKIIMGLNIKISGNI